jgi:hypothetical protein
MNEKIRNGFGHHKKLLVKTTRVLATTELRYVGLQPERGQE